MGVGGAKKQTSPENKMHKASRGEEKETKKDKSRSEKRKNLREKMTTTKKSMKYLRTRLYAEGKTRETVIKMRKGLNTLTVVSLNPDHFITDQAQQDITQQLAKNKVHIAVIQETLIPRNLNYEKNGYRVIKSAAAINPKA